MEQGVGTTAGNGVQTPTARSWRRYLRTPVVTLVCAVVLAIEACSLPRHRVFGGESIAGAMLHNARVAAGFGHSITSSPVPPKELYFVLDGSSWRTIDPELESWDELSKMMTSGPSDIVSASYKPEVRRWGIWAITNERRVYQVDLAVMDQTPIGQVLSAEERRTIRERFVDWLGQVDGGAWADAAAKLRVGDHVHHRRFAAAYVHNALSISLAALLWYSLAWVPRAPGWWRQRRKARAIARGRCPWCGYSVVGLGSGVCPECGRTRED